MKKLTALALALMMAIGLVACGSPATTDEQTTGGFKIARRHRYCLPGRGGDPSR